jgi:hypothetical protein
MEVPLKLKIEILPYDLVILPLSMDVMKTLAQQCYCRITHNIPPMERAQIREM